MAFEFGEWGLQTAFRIEGPVTFRVVYERTNDEGNVINTIEERYDYWLSDYADEATMFEAVKAEVRKRVRELDFQTGGEGREVQLL